MIVKNSTDELRSFIEENSDIELIDDETYLKLVAKKKSGSFYMINEI